MNFRLVAEILGWLLAGLGLLQGAPLLMAAAQGAPLAPYLISGAGALACGLAVALAARAPQRRMRVRDAFLVVSGGWLLASALGALPYWLAGVLAPVDALFEAVSGFTTTGATVAANVEAWPRPLLLWRAMTQWLGGMGIIVFTVAILPLLGIGGMQLFQAEMPGPVKDKLTPRIADSARRLWGVYVGLTALAFGALLAAGMESFDAFCHALTTLATGGFSTRNESLAAFGPAAQWVVVVFMAAGGVNFVLHYQLLLGRFRAVARDAELRTFALLLTLFCVAMVWAHWRAGGGVPLRESIFQVVSLATTTGYTTADFERWPEFARLLVLALFMVGGMAGSTSGGIKSLRLLIAWRWLRVSLSRIVHPHSVKPVRFNGRPVGDEVVAGVAVFLVAYVLVGALGALSVSAAGYSLETSLSAGLIAVGNIGPGLGAIGPGESFAHLPAAAKLVLCLCMVFGRLEILTLLVIFTRGFWRRA